MLRAALPSYFQPNYHRTNFNNVDGYYQRIVIVFSSMSQALVVLWIELSSSLSHLKKGNFFPLTIRWCRSLQFLIVMNVPMDTAYAKSTPAAKEKASSPPWLIRWCRYRLQHIITIRFSCSRCQWCLLLRAALPSYFQPNYHRTNLINVDWYCHLIVIVFSSSNHALIVLWIILSS